jgi:hypothetical protein
MPENLTALKPFVRLRLGFDRRSCVCASFINDLRLMLVKIQTRIELRLFQEKVFQARFMLKRASELRAVFSEGFLLPFNLALFIFGAAVETADRVLNARNRSDGIIGVEIGLIDFFATDEEFRRVILRCTSAADDLESFEVGPDLRSEIVGP